MDRGTLTQLLADLVSIRSVNPMGRAEAPPSSLQLLDYVQKWLEEHGITCQRQAIPGCSEQNLIARVDGVVRGPAVVFDAHSDTVPAEGWESRAFTPWTESGRLYGRGSCDTKAAMAAMMLALAAAARGELPPPYSVIFLVSADEENTRSGIRTFLQHRPRIEGVVVGEPTCCRPVTACKGAARWQIVTTGKTAHSSTPRQGINAVTRMAEVVRLIDEYDRKVLSEQTHPLVGPANMTATMISGGTAVNVVPGECRLNVDLRTLPNQDPAAAMLDAKAYLFNRLAFPLAHEEVKLWGGADAGIDQPFVRHCLRCCAPNGISVVEPIGVNYGCHASDFGEAHIPAVVIGPGDIAQAHAVDEYVSLDSVTTAAEIYLRIMITPMAV